MLSLQPSSIEQQQQQKQRHNNKSSNNNNNNNNRSTTTATTTEAQQQQQQQQQQSNSLPPGRQQVLQNLWQNSPVHTALHKVVPRGCLDELVGSESFPVRRSLEKSGVAQVVRLHDGGIQGGEVQGCYGDVVVTTLRFYDSGSLVHFSCLWFHYRHDEFVPLGLGGGGGGGGRNHE